MKQGSTALREMAASEHHKCSTAHGRVLGSQGIPSDRSSAEQLFYPPVVFVLSLPRAFLSDKFAEFPRYWQVHIGERNWRKASKVMSR